MRTITTVCMLLLLAACSDDSNDEEQESSADEQELQELEAEVQNIEEQLQQTEAELESVQEQREALYEENMQLKDDVLTMKEQQLEERQQADERLSEQDEVRHAVYDFFFAMHDGDADRLQDLTSSAVEVDEAEEVLRMMDEEPERSMHFIQLQQTAALHAEDVVVDGESAFAEVSMFEAEEDELSLRGIVEIEWEKDDAWQVVSMQYLQ
ncbi:hypothetical protein [Alkalicoccus chagannorensis]|uniref:hypothetical protein n=1 Tax=Alkalicoccus chagannorensis TaxID=427072 RepID=UPI00041F46D4|nr:hypothetical protein [Alkalicoccus chagannorensis]